MSVRATVALTLTVVDAVSTDAAGYASSSRNTVTYDGGNVSETLTASSTPAITAHGVGRCTMSAGAGTIDLRSLTGLNGAAVDLNGLKPRAILFSNPSANANAITIAKGASNGFTGLGSAFSLTLQPGQASMVWCDTSGTAVSGTVKTLDISGTSAQFLDYQVVAGA